MSTKPCTHIESRCKATRHAWNTYRWCSDCKTWFWHGNAKDATFPGEAQRISGEDMTLRTTANVFIDSLGNIAENQ